MTILPEAKKLAELYPVTEEEVNEYFLAGLTFDQCASLCAARSAGWKHVDVMNAIVAARGWKNGICNSNDE
jgi:hypothetical protein